jgi:hypothetical protein
LPEVRGIILPASRQPGAEAPGNTKKRVWAGEKPDLSGAAFFDLYAVPREESGKMLPTFPAKGMFGSLTLYAGAKSPGVDRESWLPASGPFALYIRVYWRGVPSSMVSADYRLSSEYNRAVNYAVRDVVRDANEDDISNVGCRHSSDIAGGHEYAGC